MTKQWDLHEATIKALYAEHTLSIVRKIMIEKYGFRASTRAYRGRLIRWGVRKYNCKKRQDRTSPTTSNDDDSEPEPDPVVRGGGGGDHPALAPLVAQQQPSETRRVSDSALVMPGRIGHQQYVSVAGGQHPLTTYTDNYDSKDRVLLPPPPQSQPQSDVQYGGWNVSVTPHHPSADGFSTSTHAAETAATGNLTPPSYFNYAAQLTASYPPNATAYETAAYAAQRGLEYNRPSPQQRHHSTGTLELPYQYEARQVTGMQDGGAGVGGHRGGVKQEMLDG
ncbi:hypothetical protein F5B20DRAFT_143773 [Whalleya microplaca]|nr:hypothetical protein F5B20DRAFT_143773 [Whalleya microplaca]